MNDDVSAVTDTDELPAIIRRTVTKGGRLTT